MIQVTIRKALEKCGATNITNVRVGRDMKYYFSYKGDKLSISLVRGETNIKVCMKFIPTVGCDMACGERVVGCNSTGHMNKGYLAEAVESLINEVDEDA